jgi:hypothetical protein
MYLHARSHQPLLARKTHSRTSCRPRSIPISPSVSRLRSGSFAACLVNARKDTRAPVHHSDPSSLCLGSLRPGPMHIRPHTYPSTRRYEQQTSALGLRTGSREPAYTCAMMADMRRGSRRDAAWRARLAPHPLTIEVSAFAPAHPHGFSSRSSHGEMQRRAATENLGPP